MKGKLTERKEKQRLLTNQWAAEVTPTSSQQVGGDHYLNMPIQPVEFNQRNGLNFCEACVIKYVSRHKHKNGAEDVRKAIHFLNLLLVKN